MNFDEATAEADLYITEIEGKRYSQLISFDHLEDYQQKDSWYRQEKNLRLQWELCHSLILNNPNTARTAVKKRYKEALRTFIDESEDFTCMWGFDMVPLTVRINSNVGKSLLEGADNWINEDTVTKVLNSCWRQINRIELNRVHQHEFECGHHENDSSWFGELHKKYIEDVADSEESDEEWMASRQLHSMLDMAENDFDAADPVVILSFA